MMHEENGSAMDVDVKGAAFEGLLEKATNEGKKGAASPQLGRAKDKSSDLSLGFRVEVDRVPSGTKEQARLASQFLSPLRGLVAFGKRLPTVETVGYSRSSLRD